MDAAIAAVNTGAIYRYVTKPWDPVQLEHTLKRGLEFFMVQHERDQLLREKMSVLHNMMIADRILALPRLRQRLITLPRAADVRSGWMISISMLINMFGLCLVDHRETRPRCLTPLSQ